MIGGVTYGEISSFRLLGRKFSKIDDLFKIRKS